MERAFKITKKCMEKKLKSKVIIFGASGAIGSSLVDWFVKNNFYVYAVTRPNSHITNISEDVKHIEINSDNQNTSFCDLIKEPVDSAVWAQGENLSDNIYSFDIAGFRKIFESNVSFILITLKCLLDNKKLKNNAKLCIISSIWQKLSRQDKLSYTVSKSALQGLVASLSVDLGKNGMLINAVLPGVIDTPMTLNNLKEDQIKSIINNTPLKSLASLEDISSAVGFLCSKSNQGISGQFICVDKGFSNAKII